MLSSFIVGELKETLTRKLGYSAHEAADVVRLLKSRFDMAAPEELPKRICRDPDDDTILATAITGRCECIVTGDKDLLMLKSVQGIHIVSPSDFWAFEEE